MGETDGTPAAMLAAMVGTDRGVDVDRENRRLDAYFPLSETIRAIEEIELSTSAKSAICGGNLGNLLELKPVGVAGR